MTMISDVMREEKVPEDSSQFTGLKKTNSMSASLVKSGFTTNKPAELQQGPLRFVITDSPSDENISKHAKQLTRLNVKHVCRASEPTYSTAPLQKEGIQVHELSFKDGDPPPDDVLDKWLDLVEKCFLKRKKKEKSIAGVMPLKDDEKISVHCVAGLGRAPVLVAVALVEYCGLSPIDAVKFIRTQRRGAINTKQLKWLENYSPKRHHAALASCGCRVS